MSMQKLATDKKFYMFEINNYAGPTVCVCMCTCMEAEETQVLPTAQVKQRWLKLVLNKYLGKQ